MWLISWNFFLNTKWLPFSFYFIPDLKKHITGAWKYICTFFFKNKYWYYNKEIKSIQVLWKHGLKHSLKSWIFFLLCNILTLFSTNLSCAPEWEWAGLTFTEMPLIWRHKHFYSRANIAVIKLKIQTRSVESQQNHHFSFLNVFLAGLASLALLIPPWL